VHDILTSVNCPIVVLTYQSTCPVYVHEKNNQRQARFYSKTDRFRRDIKTFAALVSK